MIGSNIYKNNLKININKKYLILQKNNSHGYYLNTFSTMKIIVLDSNWLK